MRKACFPVRRLTSHAFARLENRECVPVVTDHVCRLAASIHKPLTCTFPGRTFTVGLLNNLGLHFDDRLRLLAEQVREVDWVAQQGAQIANRTLGSLEVLPRDFHDIREALAMLTCFSHEFEDQEIKKPQGPQALKIRRHLPRLSLLRRSRGKILIYTTVCHGGRRASQRDRLCGWYVYNGRLDQP